MEVKSNSHLDKKEHKMYKEELDFLPQVNTFTEIWAVKKKCSRRVSRKLILAIVAVGFVTKKLHPHCIWFFKKDDTDHWVQDIYHIKTVDFFMGFSSKMGRNWLSLWLLKC